MKKYYIYELNILTLNIVAIILFILGFIITTQMPNFIITEKDVFIIFVLFMPYMILHEILHAISYRIHGAKWKNITFGAHLEKGVLCCLCKQNVSKKCILISLIYPFFFIGIVTFIIGIAIHNNILIILSVFNISGAAGDIVMFLNFLKLKNIEYSEFDDPTSFALYSKEDLSNLKMFGLKYKETKEKLNIKDYKKISISKLSIIIAIIFILLCLSLFI